MEGNLQTNAVAGINVYDENLKPIIMKFSQSPKANFMASPDLVKYFHIEKQDDALVFIENLKRRFLYLPK